MKMKILDDHLIVGKEELATEALLAPVTSQRKINDHLETTLPKPYLARALVASDSEHPTGTTGHAHNDKSVLQQHVSFFDKDLDGIIYPGETYTGLRAIGMNHIVSFIATIIFHLAFSYPTHHRWLPSPMFPIYINKIHKAKHGSDSGTYDTEGRFVPVNFENMFSKYSHKVPGKLTLRELWNMTEGSRVSHDILGRLLGKIEWGLVYYVGRDEHGYLTKETMRTLFDGTLFEHLAKKHSGGGDANTF